MDSGQPLRGFRNDGGECGGSPHLPNVFRIRSSISCRCFFIRSSSSFRSRSNRARDSLASLRFWYAAVCASVAHSPRRLLPVMTIPDQRQADLHPFPHRDPPRLVAGRDDARRRRRRRRIDARFSPQYARDHRRNAGGSRLEPARPADRGTRASAPRRPCAATADRPTPAPRAGRTAPDRRARRSCCANRARA